MAPSYLVSSDLERVAGVSAFCFSFRQYTECMKATQSVSVQFERVIYICDSDRSKMKSTVDFLKHRYSNITLKTRNSCRLSMIINGVSCLPQHHGDQISSLELPTFYRFSSIISLPPFPTIV